MLKNHMESLAQVAAAPVAVASLLLFLHNMPTDLEQVLYQLGYSVIINAVTCVLGAITLVKGITLGSLPSQLH